MKKVGFVCDTPLQIMNCINIVCNEYKNVECEKILYVGMIFNNADNIIEKVKQTGLFDKIYCFDALIPSVDASFWLKVRCLLSPKSILKHFCKDKNLTFYKFDDLFLNMLNYFTRTVLLANDCNTLCEYEDGMGAYTDASFTDTVLSASARFLNKLYKGKLMPVPQKKYLNSIELCAKNEQQICQLHKLDKTNIALDIMKEIFDYQNNDIYQKRKIVFLSQIVDVDEERIRDTEYGILDSIFENYSDDLIVRYHPRQRLPKSEKYYYDDSGCMWELEVFENITDEHILISICSTAAIMPFILANKKPYLIFTFENFKFMFTEHEVKEIYEIFKLLKEIYDKDGERIVILKEGESIVPYIKKIIDKSIHITGYKRNLL